jgi:hypothetical protein
MPIRVTCPSCHAAAACPDEYRGRALRCKKCGRSFIAGAAAPRPAAPASPKAARGRLLVAVLAAVGLGAAVGLPAAYFYAHRNHHPDGVAVGPAPTDNGPAPPPAVAGKQEPPRDTGAKPPPAANPVVWQDFTSRDWGFSARFPGAPQAVSRPGAGAKRTRMFVATVPLAPEGKQAQFTVTCTDCDPRDTADAAAFLAAATAEFAAGAKEKTPLKLDGFAGVELRGEKKEPDGPGVWQTARRIYLVRSRLYELYAGSPRDEGAAALVKPFFDSFTLLDVGAPAPAVARTPRDRALEWIAEHGAAPAERAVNEAKELLDAGVKGAMAFTLALGGGQLKEKMPVVLVGWGGELLVLDITADQARALKVAGRDLALAAFAEPAGRRADKPPFVLSDLKVGGAGSKLAGSVAFRRGEAPAGALVLRLSYLAGPSLRTQQEPVEAKDATGTLTFNVAPPAGAGSAPAGPAVLIVEACSADGAGKLEVVLSNAVAAVVTPPTGPPKGGVAELQLKVPAGWDARYNKYLGGVGGWIVTKPPPTARSEGEEARIEECPADTRTPSDYAAHLKEKDFLNVDLPGWVEVGQAEDLPDGFVIKGAVKKYPDKKTPPLLGVVAVRDLGGLKVRCFSAGLRSEKSRDELLEMFKGATFGPAK